MEGTICVDLESVKLWDNHNPYLYHAYVELKAEDGLLAEVIPYDIGFRRIEIIDKVVYLNGKRLVITGVNRHEWNARTGRCIGIEDMKADISCMLRNNINSVRTCHYPDQIPWYYMCDDAGIYVMAETNLESHGSFQNLGQSNRHAMYRDLFHSGEMQCLSVQKTISKLLKTIHPSFSGH